MTTLLNEEISHSAICFGHEIVQHHTLRLPASKDVGNPSSRCKLGMSEFAYTLFAPVDLVSDGATCPKLFGRQPLRSHLSARLCSLWPELFFFTMTHVPPARHIWHQRPHVQCIGIISHNRSTRLYIAYLSDVFLCHTQQGLLCMTVL